MHCLSCTTGAVEDSCVVACQNSEVVQAIHLLLKICVDALTDLVWVLVGGFITDQSLLLLHDVGENVGWFDS